MSGEFVPLAADSGVDVGAKIPTELMDPDSLEAGFEVVYTGVQKILKAPGLIGHANPHVRTVPNDPWAVMERRRDQ